MTRDDDEPDLQPLLDALADPDCRRILQELDEPMTVSDLSSACDIPTSTLYRKLDALVDASLATELPTPGDGGHVTRYRSEMHEVTVRMTDAQEYDVEVDHPDRSADERLAYFWSRMGEGL